MRQRLGIAQALIGRPQVLLLDEPASALDPIGRRDVLDLMEGLRGQATIFYSTHILDDVQRVSDHVAILDQGRLVRAAPTAGAARQLHPRSAAGRRAAVPRTRRPAVSPPCPGVASVELGRPRSGPGHLPDPGRAGQTDAVQRAVTRLRGRVGPHPRHQRPRDGRPRRGLPPAHRLQGACGMNAVTLDPACRRGRRASAGRTVARPPQSRPQGPRRVDPRQAAVDRPRGHDPRLRPRGRQCLDHRVGRSANFPPSPVTGRPRPVAAADRQRRCSRSAPSSSSWRRSSRR